VTEEEYQAAKARFRAAYQEFQTIKSRFSGAAGAGTRELAVAIHQAELPINEKKLKALLEMREADPEPNAPDFPGSPYTRSQVYETGIAETLEAIEENRNAIAFYSRPY
jgi:hypothetical protein